MNGSGWPRSHADADGREVDPRTRAPRQRLQGRHRGQDERWLVPVEDYDTAQREDYDTAQRAARETGQRAARETGQRAAHDTGQRAAYDTGQRAAHDTGQRAAYETGQRAAYDTGQRAAYDTGQRAAYDTGQRAAYDTAQRAAYDTAQRAAYDTAQRAAYDTAQRAAYDTVQRTGAHLPARRDLAIREIGPQPRLALPAARVVSQPRQRVRGMNAALESGVAGVGEMAPAKKPARPRQLILAVLVAFAGVAAGVLTYKSLASSPPSFSGEVVPTRVYPVSFGTTGTVTAVKIQAGQQVTAGEVLATQDGTVAEANLQEAHAAAAAASAGLFAAQHPPAGVAVQPAAVASAQQRLAAARAELAQDALALKGTEVVAPAPGVVGAVSVATGGSITASNLHSPVVTIDSGPLVVSAHLPGTEVGNVRVGQVVTLSIEPLHMSLPGRVLRLSQVPSQSQSAVSYVVLCQIDAHDPALLAGMAADVVLR